jgi:hypothetical protein
MGRTVVRLRPDGVHASVQDVHRGARELGTVAAVVVRRAFLLVAVVAVVAGCGGSSKFANDPRPPAPITVTAAIDKSRVRVSPTSIGAGPVTIIVSNQSGAAQTVTFETNEVGGSQGGIRKTTGPVSDQNTATLQVDPRQGTYQLSVKSGAIKPAPITVGKPRASSQDQLLQP